MERRRSFRGRRFAAAGTRATSRSATERTERSGSAHETSLAMSPSEGSRVSDELLVTDNREERRYEAHLNGELAGCVYYREHTGEIVLAVSYTHLRAHETPEHLV